MIKRKMYSGEAVSQAALKKSARELCFLATVQSVLKQIQEVVNSDDPNWRQHVVEIADEALKMFGAEEVQR